MLAVTVIKAMFSEIIEVCSSLCETLGLFASAGISCSSPLIVAMVGVRGCQVAMSYLEHRTNDV